MSDELQFMAKMWREGHPIPLPGLNDCSDCGMTEDGKFAPCQKHKRFIRIFAEFAEITPSLASDKTRDIQFLLSYILGLEGKP